MSTAVNTKPRLKETYRKEIVPAMQAEFSYGNPMQVPGLVKIVVNMGVGRAVQQPSLLDGAVSDMAAITGQKPIVNKATKSIAEAKANVEQLHSQVVLANQEMERARALFKNGWITNMYGRRVQIDEPLDHILVNSYSQSTGADVAMLGFQDILQRFKKLPGVVPLYVLAPSHDFRV